MVDWVCCWLAGLFVADAAWVGDGSAPMRLPLGFGGCAGGSGWPGLFILADVLGVLPVPGLIWRFVGWTGVMGWCGSAGCSLVGNRSDVECGGMVHGIATDGFVDGPGTVLKHNRAGPGVGCCEDGRAHVNGPGWICCGHRPSIYFMYEGGHSYTRCSISMLSRPHFFFIPMLVCR